MSRDASPVRTVQNALIHIPPKTNEDTVLHFIPAGELTDVSHRLLCFWTAHGLARPRTIPMPDDLVKEEKRLTDALMGDETAMANAGCSVYGVAKIYDVPARTRIYWIDT